MADRTPFLLAGGAALLWLLSKPAPAAADTPDALQRAYAARLAAGDPLLKIYLAPERIEYLKTLVEDAIQEALAAPEPMPVEADA